MPLGKSIFSPFSYQCFASGNEEDIWMSALLVGYREVSVLCAAVLVEYREFCTVSCCTESSVLCAAEPLWQRRMELVQLVGHHFKKPTHKVQGRICKEEGNRPQYHTVLSQLHPPNGKFTYFPQGKLAAPDLHHPVY